MPLYSRPQLTLLLTLAGILLVGIAVREWRAGFPELAERLERFDREERPALVAPPARPEGRAARPPKLAAPAGPVTATPDADAPAAPQPPVAPAESRRLDLNRATAAELARLPGIGPTLAQRITEERERRGRFESPDALRAVLGMGPKKLAAVRDLLSVEP